MNETKIASRESKSNTPTVYYTCVESPLGDILLTSDGSSLTGLTMQDDKRDAKPGANWRREEVPVLSEAARQLTAYFAGTLTAFDLPLAASGTEFQQRVWKELAQIPYGTTLTYGELAARIGNPNASRAVGLANGRNPVSIVVPCHRVIGASGKLTGYRFGVGRKNALLAHEQAMLAG